MSVTRIEDCVVVHAIAVHKSERRQGKATQALRDLVEKSRQDGAKVLRVEAVYNWRLEALLEKEGYVRQEEEDGSDWNLVL